MTFQKPAVKLWDYAEAICPHKEITFLGEDEGGKYICDTCGRIMEYAQWELLRNDLT